MKKLRKTIRKHRPTRNRQRGLRFEVIEPRRLLAVVVSVGDWVVADDVTEFRLPITVSGGDELEGINLRVQLDDGSAAGSDMPVIVDLDLAGTPQSPTIWTGRGNGDLGEDITPSIATVWTDTLDQYTVEADGVLAFAVLDLTGCPTGTWSITIADTLAGSTELIDVSTTLVDGSITIIEATPDLVAEVAVVSVQQPTDISGSQTGESPTLPASATDLDEWAPHWLEVWAKSTHPTDGLSLFSGDILFDESVFVQGVGLAEAGPVFRPAHGTFIAVTTGPGTIYVHATTGLSSVGTDDFVLVGRIPMSGQPAGPGVDAAVESAMVSTTTGASLVQLESSAGGQADQVGPTEVEVESVGYDLNDNGRVGIADLALFASYFGQGVAQATDPLVAAADYNEDGEIGIADLAYFAANFGKVPGDTLLYPENKSTSDAASEEPATIPIAIQSVATPIATQTDVALIEEIPEVPNNTSTQSTPMTTNSRVDMYSEGPSASPILNPDDADLYFTESEKASTDQSLNSEPVDDRFEEDLFESLLEQLV